MRRSFVCRIAPIISGLSMTAGAFGAWPLNPDTNVAVADRTGDQGGVKIAPAPGGGWWVGWFDNSSGSYRVYAQKLDAFGNEIGPHNGWLVSDNPQSTSLEDWDLRADATGGCVLAFNDTRAGPDRDIYAYRLSPTGVSLWNGLAGVTITNNINADTQPRIVQLTNAEFAIVYSVRTQAGGQAPGLYMNRLDAGGALLLGAGGVRIAGDGVAEQPGFHDILPGESNSILAVWVFDTSTFQSPRRVRGQRFDSTGAGLWNAGVPFELSGASIVPIVHSPRIITDNAGGAIFSWHSSALQAFAQWVSAAGAVQWGGGSAVQLSVDGANLSMDPALQRTDNAATVAFFRKTNGGQTQSALYYQVLDPAGNRTAGDPGMPIVPFGPGAVAAPRAGRTHPNQVVGIYSTTVFGGTDTTVFATPISTSGAPNWVGPASVRLSPVSGPRFRLGLAMAANGVGAVAWEGDTRNVGTTPDIFAQNINPNGTIGACPGDATFDSTVSFADLNIVLSQFGQSGPFLAGDVNADGIVNFADLNIVLSAFGAVCA